MKRLPPVIWIVALCAVACGSRTPGPSAVRIHDGDESELSDCTFLQKVEGTASASDESAEIHAKRSARAQAAAIGATDIRWIVPCCTYVEADAYRCDVPALAQSDD
jgi:hypothetical protein